MRKPLRTVCGNVMMKLLLLLWISALLLSGCTIAPLNLSNQPRKVTGTCPHLAAPPDSAVTALADDAKVHPATGRWLIALSKHYDSLDVCTGNTAPAHHAP